LKLVSETYGGPWPFGGLYIRGFEFICKYWE
jgi:hypothetical protein